MLREKASELTSCRDQVPVWNEEFIPIMLLQHVRKDLQGKALLLAALLAPLLWLHLGVRQVGIVVLVVCQQETTVTAISIHTGSVLFLNIKNHSHRFLQSGHQLEENKRSFFLT